MPGSSKGVRVCVFAGKDVLASDLASPTSGVTGSVFWEEGYDVFHMAKGCASFYPCYSMSSIWDRYCEEEPSNTKELDSEIWSPGHMHRRP